MSCLDARSRQLPAFTEPKEKRHIKWLSHLLSKVVTLLGLRDYYLETGLEVSAYFAFFADRDPLASLDNSIIYSRQSETFLSMLMCTNYKRHGLLM